MDVYKGDNYLEEGEEHVTNTLQTHHLTAQGTLPYM